MKTKRFAPVILALFLASMIPVMGQQTTDQKKKENDIRKKRTESEIILDTTKSITEKELQKAMSDALVSEEKALKTKMQLGILDNKDFFRQAEALQNSKRKLEEMKSSGQNWDSHTYSDVTPFMWKSNNADLANVYSMYSGDRENTSLSISKSLEDVTFSTDFYYDVKSGSSNVSFFVNGSLKVGELKITLKKPDKTAFQEITISPLADVNWNQQFRWDEDETNEYLGKWTISITAAKVNGNYRVQVNSR